MEDVKDKLMAVCLEWRKKHRPLCAESIYQVDHVNLACPELAEEIFNLIGYEPHETEE